MLPVEWVEEKGSTLHTQQFLREDLFLFAYFVSLLLTFWFIGLYLLLLLVSPGLTYEIYSGGGPSMYVYCVVCYIISAPYVKSNVSLHTVHFWWRFRMSNRLNYELYSLKCFLHNADLCRTRTDNIHTGRCYILEQVAVFWPFFRTLSDFLVKCILGQFQIG